MLRFNKISLLASGLLPVDKPPPALAFLSGICEANSGEYEIFDLNIHIRNSLGEEQWNQAYTMFTSLEQFENKELLDKIDLALDLAVDIVLKQSADLVAIAVFSYQQIQLTKLFLTKLKSKSSAPVIAGGPGISYEVKSNTTAGKMLLDKNLIDYYVLGEGEYVLDRFLKGHEEIGLNSKKTPHESWAVQIDNLDDCVLPTYKKINFNNYIPGINLDHSISLTGSRGCVRRCTFCDVGHIWKKFRFRSADNIVAELTKHIDETGITQFWFTDSLINGSLKQFTDLMKNLSNLRKNNTKFRDIKYTGQFIIRPPGQHKEELYRLMSESGCHNIIVGVETGSDSVRFHMGKKFTNVDLDYHLEMSSKYKIKNAILMFTGYPTETLNDHEDTLTMFKRYQKYLLDETIINVTLHTPFVLLKNTPIDAMRHEVGITNETYNTYFFDVTTNPDFTVKERFRRYIELSKLILDLKYPGSYADLSSLTDHINALKNFNKVN